GRITARVYYDDEREGDARGGWVIEYSDEGFAIDYDLDPGATLAEARRTAVRGVNGWHRDCYDHDD
ncbi:unnamed protein product, partial [marine sediment metagenome]